MKLLALICFYFLPFTTIAQEYQYSYTIFTNSQMGSDYFFSKTSSDGSSFIENVKNRLPVEDKIFHTPGNALKLEYTNGENGKWEANIYKEKIRGQDHFNKEKLFSFSIYPVSHTTQSEFPAVRLIFKDSTFSNKITFSTDAVNEWSVIVIRAFHLNSERHKIPEDVIGIQFSQFGNDDSKHLMYIDDIEFVSDLRATTFLPTPVLTSAIGYPRHIDITWAPLRTNDAKFVKIWRSEDSINFVPVGVQLPLSNRYADYTGVSGRKYFYQLTLLDERYGESDPSQVESAVTKEMNEEEFLSMIQEACFRYYWDGAETNSSLAKENIPGRTNMIASGASGFGILALIAGTERKFITRKEAVTRFLKIVNFLEKADKFHGAFSHFIADHPVRWNRFSVSVIMAATWLKHLF